VFEQLSFYFLSKPETGEGTIFPDDPVARDDQADGIGAVGAADCARGGGVADLNCDVGIAACFAEGDLLEGGPDFFLEGGADKIEGQIEITMFASEIGEDLASSFSCSFEIANELFAEEPWFESGRVAKCSGDNGIVFVDRD